MTTDVKLHVQMLQCVRELLRLVSSSSTLTFLLTALKLFTSILFTYYPDIVDVFESHAILPTASTARVETNSADYRSLRIESTLSTVELLNALLQLSSTDESKLISFKRVIALDRRDPAVQTIAH